MKEILLFFLCVNHGILFGQKAIRVNTTSAITNRFRSGIPLRPVEAPLTFKTPSDYKQYFIKKYVFDTKQYFFEQYLDKRILRDSLVTIFKTLNGNADDQVNLKTRNTIYVFIGLKNDSTVNIIIDRNCNKNFMDDGVLHYAAKEVFPFRMKLDYVRKKKIYSIPYSLELAANFQYLNFAESVTNEFSISIRSLNSRIGHFQLGNKSFTFELYSANFRNLFDLNAVDVNFSKPDSSLREVDFNNTLLYSAKKDVIISGNYQFKFKQTDLFGNHVIVEYTKLTESTPGYEAGYTLPDLPLDLIADTVIVPTRVKKFALSQKYLLLDFWGTWCGPCIKSFPKMREIENKFQSKGLSTIGIACEYKKDLQAIKKILDEQGVNWTNAFVLKNQGERQNIASYMNIESFPTYILLNKDLKILYRESGQEGLDKIVLFLQQRFR